MLLGIMLAYIYDDDAVLPSAYPVHGTASKVNCSGADAQVVSFPVVFMCDLGTAPQLGCINNQAHV